MQISDAITSLSPANPVQTLILPDFVQNNGQNGYYYGYRYYNAECGRWTSRDLVAETGGINLYGMTDNDLVNQTDLLGMWIVIRDSTRRYAIAYKEDGDRLRTLASEVNLSEYETRAWARKDSQGHRFTSINKAESACEVYIPNEIYSMWPDIPPQNPPQQPLQMTQWPGLYWIFYYQVQYSATFALRQWLYDNATIYQNKGFYIKRYDYDNPNEPSLSLLRWPLYGIMMGGHGSVAVWTWPPVWNSNSGQINLSATQSFTPQTLLSG